MWLIRNRLRRLTFIVAIVTTANSLNGIAAAQGRPATGPAIDYQKSGVRFQVKASIIADRVQSDSTRDNDRRTASLNVQLRISAHAAEADFFGTVTESFDNFRLIDGSGERLFWQETTCHQRRGLPKVAVTAIDGSIATENGRIEVKARPRQLGKLLPPDEISAGGRLPGGADETGNYIAYRSRTKTSHLAVDVRIYTFDCVLFGGMPPARPPAGRPLR